MRRSGLAIVALLVVVGCSGGGSSDGPGEFACNELRGFAHDVSAGIVVPSEYRGRAQKVYNYGAYAHTPTIARTSTELLASFTAGVESREAAAVTAMDAACTGAGF